MPGLIEYRYHVFARILKYIKYTFKIAIYI